VQEVLAVTRSVARLGATFALAAAGLTGLVTARAQSSTAHARPAACHSTLSVVARGGGSPDDLAWDGRKLLVSDIDQGRIGVVAHGHTRPLLGHIAAPEGIVPGPENSLIVAAQGTNQILQIGLPHGPRKVLARLSHPSPGEEGVDGIDADGSSAVFIPDSGRGRLYVLHLKPHKLTLVARGMHRPVAAVKWDGGIVVADEYANAIWRIGRNHVRTKLADIALPDDFAVISHHLIVNSLAGEIWEVAPHLRLLSKAFEPTVTDPQGLVAAGPDSVLIADQGRNKIYRLAGLRGCL
jgi:hypothetical protein